MKITLFLNNKAESKIKVNLFGARYNYLRANFGMPREVEITKIIFNDKYNEQIGVSDDVIHNTEYTHILYQSFLMDCIKYNLLVTSVNGELLIKISDNPLQYKVIKSINPYSDIYETELLINGENKIVIELQRILKSHN